MKTVFSDSSQVAHLWANKQQTEAKNSNRSFYFWKDTIYSYGSHFPIAKHIEVCGQPYVLFTVRSYSNTTAKHISITRSACSHKELIFCYDVTATNEAHESNFSLWQRDAENFARKLSTARKPELYISELHHIRKQAKIYADLFSLELPSTLLAAVTIEDKEGLKVYLEQKEAMIAKQEAEKKSKQQKEHRAQIKKFLEFKSHRVFSNGGIDVIRVNGENVETSQAVKIPVAVAKRIYNSLLSGQLQKEGKVLDYIISSIDKKHLIVGCHKFEVKHLLTVGKTL